MRELCATASREFARRRVGAVRALRGARAARRCRAALLRFGLIVEQVYNAGALSLVIIMTVRPVRRHGARPAGLTTCCERFGSEESLGTAAALGLLKELGPVVTALLFAGRAGTALASESA